MTEKSEIWKEEHRCTRCSKVDKDIGGENGYICKDCFEEVIEKND